MGCFSSILPVRCTFGTDATTTTGGSSVSSPVETLAECTQRVKRVVLACFSHPDVPWDKLLSTMRVPRAAPGVNPLFTSNFSYLPTGYDGSSLTMEHAAFDYWLAMGRDESGELHGHLMYAADTIAPCRADAIVNSLEWLIRTCIDGDSVVTSSPSSSSSPFAELVREMQLHASHASCNLNSHIAKAQLPESSSEHGVMQTKKTSDCCMDDIWSFLADQSTQKDGVHIISSTTTLRSRDQMHSTTSELAYSTCLRRCEALAAHLCSLQRRRCHATTTMQHC